MSTLVDYFDGTDYVERNATCSDPVAVASIINSLITGSTLQINCGFYNWRVYQCSGRSLVCFNCKLNCLSTVTCPGRSDILNPCYSGCNDRIAAGSIISFKFEEKRLFPRLSNFKVLSSSKTIVVQANLSTVGTMYCIATDSSSVYLPTLVDLYGPTAFTSSPSVGSNNSATVAITGLSPQVNYSIHCGSSDFSRHYMPVSEVISRRLYFATQCCRTIVPIVVPSSIAPFFPSTDPYSQVPFSIALGTVPTGLAVSSIVLQVSLVAVKCKGQANVPTGNMAIALPSKFLFDSSSIDFTASFYVQSSMPGCYMLVANSTGYQSYNTTINVRSARVAPPPPVVTSAVLSNDATSVLIQLNTESNYGMGIIPNYLSAFSCSYLLNFPRVSAYDCYWAASTKVIVYSRYGPLNLIPGVSIMLKEGVIRAACQLSSTVTMKVCNSTYSFASAQNITVQSPVTPNRPRVILLGASRMSTCDSFVLDPTAASGSAGRPWANLQWSVSSNSRFTNISRSVEDYLNTNFVTSTSQLITVPRSLLDPGRTYYISLILTNFLGSTGIGTVTVSMTQSANVPQVRVYGSSLVSYRWQPLTLFASADFPPCVAVANQSISYVWTVYDGLQQVNSISSISREPRYFRVNAYTFDVGKNYTIKAMALIRNTRTNTSLYGSSSFSVFIGRSGIFAQISGGAMQTVSSNQIAVLDASLSYDVDYPSIPSSSFSYKWMCVMANPNRGGSCGSMVLTDGAASQRLLGSTFGVGVFNITVIVSNSVGSVGSYSVLLTVTAANVPSIWLETPQRVYTAIGTIILSARVSVLNGSSCVATWTSSNFVESGTFGFPYVLSPIAAVLPTGVRTFQLALNSNSLRAGVTYTFTLTARYVSNSASSSASVSIYINAVPVGGILQITPSSGTALQDQFQWLTSSWFDEDLPLEYLMVYYVQDPNVVNIAKNYDQVPYSSAYMAQGLPSKNYLVTCVVTAMDVFGGSSNVSTQIEVNPWAVTEASIAQAFTRISTVTANTMAVEATQLIDAVIAGATAVTCNVRTSCATLNRFECQSLADTCGSCLPGYIGYDGEGNTACLPKATASARHKLGESCIRNSDCVTAVCSSRVCVSATKSCPSSCSSHGSCVFFKQGEQISTSCKASDALCQAECHCDTGYFGRDCSLTTSANNFRTSVVSTLCSSLLRNQQRQDHSTATVLSIASSIVSLLADYSFASDVALEQCSSALLEPILSEPSLVCQSETTWSTVISALSTLAGKGSNLPLTILNDISNAISIISAACQQSLAIGQQPKVFSSANIRSSTAMVDGSTLGVKVIGAVSDFELTNDLKSGSVALSLSDTSTSSEGTSVGISILEFNNNPYETQSNSSALALQTQFYSSLSRRRLQTQNVTTNVTLINTVPITYRYISPSVMILHCVNRSRTGYWVNSSCPDGRVVDVFCERNTVGYFNVSCAGFRSEPACESSSRGFCRLGGFDSVSTQCICDVLPGIQTTIFSNLRQYRTEFGMIFTTIPIDEFETVPYVVSVLLGGLFALFFVAVLSYRFDYREMSKARAKSKKKVYLSDYLAEEDDDSLDKKVISVKKEAQKEQRQEQVVPVAKPGLREFVFQSVVPDIFRNQYMDLVYQSYSWQAQFRVKLWERYHFRNFFIPILKHVREFPPGTMLHRVEHFFHVLDLIMRVVHVVFVVTVGIYYLMSNDRAPCSDFYTANECRSEMLFYDITAKCEWIEYSQSCIPHRPHFKAQQIVAFAGLAVLIAITLSLAYRCLIDLLLFSVSHLKHTPVKLGNWFPKSRKAVVPVITLPDTGNVLPNAHSKRRIFEGIEDADDIQQAEIGSKFSNSQLVEDSSNPLESNVDSEHPEQQEQESPLVENKVVTPRINLSPNPNTSSSLATDNFSFASPNANAVVPYTPGSASVDPTNPLFQSPMSPHMDFSLPLHLSSSTAYNSPADDTIMKPETDVKESARTERSRDSDEPSGFSIDSEPAYDTSEAFFLASRHRERRAARVERSRVTIDNLPVNEEAKLLISAYRNLNERCPLANQFVIPEYYVQYDMTSWPTRYDPLMFEIRDMKYFRVCDIRNRFLKKRNIAAMFHSRQAALDITQYMIRMNSDKEREKYLLRRFMIDLMPPMEQFAIQYLIDTFSHCSISKTHPLTLLFGLEQLGFLVLCLLSVVGLVVQTVAILYFSVTCSYSITASDVELWALILGLAFIEVFVLIYPLYILVKDFLVDEVLLMRPFTRLVHYFAARSRLVLLRTRGIVHEASLALIQHFNPACRASRAFPHLPVARLLLSVNDYDLREPMVEIDWFDHWPALLRPNVMVTRKYWLITAATWQHRLKTVVLLVYMIFPIAHRVYYEWCCTIAIVGFVSILQYIYIAHGSLAIGVTMGALFLVVEANELLSALSWLRRQRWTRVWRRRSWWGKSNNIHGGQYYDDDYDDGLDDGVDAPHGSRSVVSRYSANSFYELDGESKMQNDGQTLFSGTSHAHSHSAHSKNASVSLPQTSLSLFPANSLLSLQKPADSWAEKAFELAPASLARNLSEQSLSSLIGQRASIAVGGDSDVFYATGGKYQGESQLLRPTDGQGSLLLTQNSFLGLGATDDEGEDEAAHGAGLETTKQRMPMTSDFIPRNIARRYLDKQPAKGETTSTTSTTKKTTKTKVGRLGVGEDAMDADEDADDDVDVDDVDARSFDMNDDDDDFDDEQSAASVISGPELTTREKRRQKRQFMLGYGLSRTGGSHASAKRASKATLLSRTLPNLSRGSSSYAAGQASSGDGNHRTVGTNGASLSSASKATSMNGVLPRPSTSSSSSAVVASTTTSGPVGVGSSSPDHNNHSNSNNNQLSSIQQVYAQKLQSLQSLQQERTQRLLRRELRRRTVLRERDNQYGPGGLALAERKTLLQDQLRRLIHRQEQRRHYESSMLRTTEPKESTSSQPLQHPKQQQQPKQQQVPNGRKHPPSTSTSAHSTAFAELRDLCYYAIPPAIVLRSANAASPRTHDGPENKDISSTAIGTDGSDDPHEDESEEVGKAANMRLIWFNPRIVSSPTRTFSASKRNAAVTNDDGDGGGGSNHPNDPTGAEATAGTGAETAVESATIRAGASFHVDDAPFSTNKAFDPVLGHDDEASSWLTAATGDTTGLVENVDYTLPSFDDEDTLPVLQILDSFLPTMSGAPSGTSLPGTPRLESTTIGGATGIGIGAGAGVAGGGTHHQQHQHQHRIDHAHYRPMRYLTQDGDETLHVTGRRRMSQQQRQRPNFVRQRQAQVEARRLRLETHWSGDPDGQPPQLPSSPPPRLVLSHEDIAQRAAVIAELLHLNDASSTTTAMASTSTSPTRSFLLRPGQSLSSHANNINNNSNNNNTNHMGVNAMTLQLAQAQPIVLPQRRRIVRVPRTQHPMYL